MKKSVFLNYLLYIIFMSFQLIKSQEDEKNTTTTEDNQSIFEKNFLVPQLLPSVPKEVCSVFYNPGLIIVTGQPYCPYQIQDFPEISWNYKNEKFYTVVIIGEFQKDENIPKTEKSWFQWVAVNIRKNNLSQKSATILQPYSNTPQFEPNATHKVVYAFAVFEQFKKIDLNLNDKDNSPEILLQKHFTPLSNFVKSFNGSFLLAGNFFYVIPKPSGIIRNSSPVRYINWRQNELMNIMKPHDYVGTSSFGEPKLN